MSGSPTLSKVVAQIGDLPAIPDVVAQLMELTSDPNVGVSDVCEAIEQDPALAAKLLRVSNSSYYGMRQVVGTLKLALVILGAREVRNIVLGISVLDALHDRETEVLLHEHGLWTHSVLVAGIAKKLADHVALSVHGEDFITALLHDVGKLVLWRYFGDEYHSMYVEIGKNGGALHEAERAAYGFDHADVGAALASAWNLPESLTCALQHHHPGPGRNLANCPVPRLAAVVRLANEAAHEDSDTEPASSMRSCASEAWDILELEGPAYSKEERHALLSGIVEELRGSPSLAL